MDSNEDDLLEYRMQLCHYQQFAERVGIFPLLAELTKHTSDPVVYRATIIDQFPRYVQLLCTVEKTMYGLVQHGEFVLSQLFLAAQLDDLASPASPSSLKKTKKRTKAEKTEQKTHVNTKKKKERETVFARFSYKTDLLDLKDYGVEWLRRFHVMDTACRADDCIKDYTTYTTVHHCTGKWGMEQIIDALRDQEFLAIGLRDDVTKTEECTRYKVITNQPFLVKGVE